MNPSSPRLPSRRLQLPTSLYELRRTGWWAGRRTGTTILLFTLTCLSTFNGIHGTTQKLDFKEKFGFLNEQENRIFSNAIREIKWRIRAGYLAELHDDLDAVRWLVKKLAGTFMVKTTTIAAQIGTRAAIRYFDMANQYLEMLVTHGQNEAKKYQYLLYPEYEADRYRMDHPY